MGVEEVEMEGTVGKPHGGVGKVEKPVHVVEVSVRGVKSGAGSGQADQFRESEDGVESWEAGPLCSI
jgi:hypothetical protein